MDSKDRSKISETGKISVSGLLLLSIGTFAAFYTNHENVALLGIIILASSACMLLWTGLMLIAKQLEKINETLQKKQP